MGEARNRLTRGTARPGSQSKAGRDPRKLLDVTRLKDLGWQPKIGLRDGLERTYLWYREQGGAIRGVDG